MYNVEGFEVLLELVAQRRVDVLQPPVVGYVGAGCLCVKVDNDVGSVTDDWMQGADEVEECLVQVSCFIREPFSDEGDDRSALLVAPGLVDAMCLFQTAQIFSLGSL